VLDDETRKIAIETNMDEWAVDDQFKRFRALNRNTRLRRPKDAWAAFCKKYKRPAWLDWEGLAQWCPELWAIADRTFPDERAAERYFYKALKRREMKRKGKGKPRPIGNVAGWWEAVCKAYVPEEPRQQNQSAPRPDGATNRRPEKHNGRRPDGEGGFVEWHEESPG
jgi:hypothetical protein